VFAARGGFAIANEVNVPVETVNGEPVTAVYIEVALASFCVLLPSQPVEDVTVTWVLSRDRMVAGPPPAGLDTTVSPTKKPSVWQLAMVRSTVGAMEELTNRLALFPEITVLPSAAMGPKDVVILVWVEFKVHVIPSGLVKTFPSEENGATKRPPAYTIWEQYPVEATGTVVQV
jgi:hypothetical protein